jgi:hypothetical protein
MKNYSRQIEDVMLFYPSGIPIVALQSYRKGETMQEQSLKGKCSGAILTSGLDPEQFRRLARLMLRTGQAFLQDGFFRVKDDDHV